MTLHFGFKNEPDVPEALRAAARPRLRQLDDMDTTYFLSRDIVIPTLGGGMADWREKLFAGMHRNAARGGRLPAPADEPRRRARLEGRDLKPPRSLRSLPQGPAGLGRLGARPVMR